MKGISQAHSRAMEEGRYDDAIKWAKKGIKEYGDSLGFPKMLAAAYEMNGDMKKLLRRINKFTRGTIITMAIGFAVGLSINRAIREKRSTDFAI